MRRFVKRIDRREGVRTQLEGGPIGHRSASLKYSVTCHSCWLWQKATAFFFSLSLSLFLFTVDVSHVVFVDVVVAVVAAVGIAS